jgi:hypothetical protein
MNPQDPTVLLSGGKAPEKDLKSVASRRNPRKTISKVGKIRRPRRLKPGSK